MRVENIEFRQLREGRRPEIVQWNSRDDSEGEYCFTLCWWGKDKEGYSVEFIGNRPFEYNNTKLFWTLMLYGQKVLDAQFNLEFYKDNL